METSIFCRSLIAPVAMAAFILFTLDAQAAEKPAIVRVVGSTTVESSLLIPRRDRMRAKMGIDLELNCKGTGAGLLKLAKGEADVSGASETLPEAIMSAGERAKENHDAANLPNNLVYSELGHERIVIIVNAKNTDIKKLSKKQLSDIFTQKIINWKELGGMDKPILVVIGPIGSGTRALFQKVIMDGKEYPTKMEGDGLTVSAITSSNEYAAVEHVPNAIAAVSESSASKSKSIFVVETPVIDRPLGFITIGKPSTNVQKMIDFLHSNEHSKLEQEQ